MNRLLMTVALGILGLSAAPPGALAQEAEEAPEQARRITIRSVMGSGSYLGVVLRDVSQADIDRLGLSDGDTYQIDFFFAERHRTQSNFRIQTNMPIESMELPTVSMVYD